MLKDKSEKDALIGLGDKLSGEHLNAGKNRVRNRILMILAVLILGAILYFVFFANNSGTKYEFVNVSRKDLKESVEVTGNVEAGATINLSFRASGQIDKINFAAGTKLKKGDIIANLKNRDQQLQVDQAKANLSGAQANLNQKLAGSTNEDKKIAQAGVDRANAAAEKTSIDYDNAKRELTLIKQKYAQSEKTAQLQVDDAKSKYDYALKNQSNTGMTQDQAIETAKKDLEAQLYSTGSQIQQSLINLKAIIYDDGYSALGPDVKRLDPYKNTLANNLYNEVKNEFDPMYAKLKNTTGYLPDQLKAYAVQEQNLITKLLEAQKLATDELSVLSVSGTLSSVQLSSFKSGISADSNSLSSSLAGLNLKYQAILNALLGVDTSSDTQNSAVSSAKNFYDQAVQNLEEVKINDQVDLNSREANIRSLQAQYSIAKADIESAQASSDQVKAGPRSVDIAFLKTEVLARQIAVSLAEESLEKTLLRAPLDGQLSRKNIDEGEEVISSSSAAATSGQALFEMISSDKFKINAEIAEVDIGKIQVGDKADIILDAIGDETKFDGTIAQIDPVQTVIQDVVFYKAEVVIDTLDSRIKPGMSANIDIVLNKVDQVLTIPEKAIQTEGGQKFVRVLDGVKVKNINVETGIRDLQGNIEIKSGLSEGQQIILRTLNGRT